MTASGLCCSTMINPTPMAVTNARSPPARAVLSAPRIFRSSCGREASDASLRQIAQLPQRDEVLGPISGRGPQDNMIEQLNAQELAGAEQIAGHLDIRLRWRRVAAGMIMRHHDGRRAGRDGSA